MFEMNNECGEGGRLCVLLAQYPEGCFWPGVFVLVRTCPFRSFVWTFTLSHNSRKVLYVMFFHRLLVCIFIGLELG